MLQTLLSTLRSNTSNDLSSETRRVNPRRKQDRCVIEVCGQTFPVEDWSLGGVLVRGDERLFGVDQEVGLTLKFKLRNTIISVDHRGHIVRKGNGKIAVAFEPLSQTISRHFQKVIDDQVAEEFAVSQAT